MRDHIRTLLAAVAVTALASVAYADSPHFVTGPTATIDTSTGDLVVTWKEAGLGNTPVTYDLEVQAISSEWQCFTKSGNKPQGAPNSGGEGNVLTTETIKPHNGQITGNLDLAPLPEKPDGTPITCNGGGLKLCLTSVEYDGITFADETNGIPGISNVSLGPTPASPFFPNSCISKK